MIEPEKLCIEIENYINSNVFKTINADTGYDVKVLVVDTKELYDITLCIPFIASKIKSYQNYIDRILEIKKDLYSYLSGRYKKTIRIQLNTKDRKGYGYLTLFGTALDKGDFGIVGRGNKYENIISVNRPNIVEATSGKNIFRATGKICQLAANISSMAIYKKLNLDNQVYIIGRNGRYFSDIDVFIEIQDCSTDIKNIIVQCVKDTLLHDKIIDFLLNSCHIIDRMNYLLTRETNE